MIQGTTLLGECLFQSLQIGWSHKVVCESQPDNSYKHVERSVVTLSLPITSWRDAVRLVDMDARTALNLLQWLEQEREKLEAVVKEA